MDEKPDLESTASLLELIREGDEQARDRLLSRYLPILRRWAHGRLPVYARDLMETDDLVQVTLLRALDRLKEFEPRREGAFLAYLRRILINQLRDEIRRISRRPVKDSLSKASLVSKDSPLEELVGRETLEKYEKALKQLPRHQQEAVILKIEFGFTHQEIADAVGSPSANAARMMVARTMVRLAEVMNEP